ncbi:hypothetical protein AJ78_08924, partial [Emergomyces pasteurianus Ep9510]
NYQIAQIWVTLKKLFLQIQLELRNVNDLRNLMTLMFLLHAVFNFFTLAFELTVEQFFH